MSIPAFTDEGLLPPGIHLAAYDELLHRLGGPSAQRRAIAESLGWAVDAARRAGITRFIVDGSFVDDKSERNDADCLLLCGPDYPADPAAAEEIEEGFPYVELLLFEQEDDFEVFLQLQFTVDRFGRRRGVVEIQL